jgi:hypothetical protein
MWHRFTGVFRLGSAVILCSGAVAAWQGAPAAPAIVAVRPIAPPATPLPPESATAGVTQFSFIAYGDTRSGAEPDVPGDGRILQAQHSRLVDLMLARAQALASTPHPIRFIVQSGDAVLRGQNGAMWNVSFSPIIERLSRADLPYFFAVGNHDVTGMPPGDPGRALGLHNTLTAVSKLIPPEGSPRRLSGYATFAFGYGNLFVIAMDSNIPSDPVQLAWVTDQLDHLDRSRYPLVIAFFHHPAFTSGQHGGPTTEPQSETIRNLYNPLFRKHHVRMTITGHDHLLDHWIERYSDSGKAYRRDDVVTGGGGAPTYRYTGEPDLRAYLGAGAAQQVSVEHLMRPGRTVEENPHHFLIVQVDGDKLSLEVVGIGPGPYTPYRGRSRIDLND